MMCDIRFDRLYFDVMFEYVSTSVFVSLRGCARQRQLVCGSRFWRLFLIFYLRESTSIFSIFLNTGMRFFVQAKPFPVGDTQSFLAKNMQNLRHTRNKSYSKPIFSLLFSIHILPTHKSIHRDLCYKFK